MRARCCQRVVALAFCFNVVVSAAAAGQSDGTPSASVSAPATRPAYVTRGDETEQRYNQHREQLEAFYHRLGTQLERDAPDLRQKLESPAPVPFGYQILPAINDPASGARQTRIKFSPFSWPRTDSVIARGRDSLAMIESRFDSVRRLIDSAERHRGYEQIANQYKTWVAVQKFMSSLVQYNRLWQSEIARLSEPYKAANLLKDAAVARQALIDSIATRDQAFKVKSQPRMEALTRQINDAMRKNPTPSFVRVEKPAEHKWVVTVPLYTDIADTGFVARARAIIENAWHVHDGEDDFTLKVDLRPLAPSQIYGADPVPAAGFHIDVSAHVNRFPQDGAVLTTGGNSTYAMSHAIIVGPGTLARSTLVHEFSHLLGFRDSYFRSFVDRGADGYAITEVILDPDDVLVVPERSDVRRGHFEAVIENRAR